MKFIYKTEVFNNILVEKKEINFIQDTQSDKY